MGTLCSTWRLPRICQRERLIKGGKVPKNVGNCAYCDHIGSNLYCGPDLAWPSIVDLTYNYWILCLLWSLITCMPITLYWIYCGPDLYIILILHVSSIQRVSFYRGPECGHVPAGDFPGKLPPVLSGSWPDWSQSSVSKLSWCAGQLTYTPSAKGTLLPTNEWAFDY